MNEQYEPYAHFGYSTLVNDSLPNKALKKGNLMKIIYQIQVVQSQKGGVIILESCKFNQIQTWRKHVLKTSLFSWVHHSHYFSFIDGFRCSRAYFSQICDGIKMRRRLKKSDILSGIVATKFVITLHNVVITMRTFFQFTLGQYCSNFMLLQ